VLHPGWRAPFPRLRTVDFDDQFCARRIEIDEVGTNGFRAVELDIGQRLATNVGPQTLFGVGLTLKEVAGEVF
jgi:hypothetical protein